MSANMLELTRDQIAALSDDQLDAEWRRYMAFSTERQRLREQVQRMMRSKAPARRVTTADITEGAMTTTKAGNREILLAKVAGQIYAIDNACGHSGYPLDRGRLSGHVVTCRWHDAQFDLRTGAMLSPGRDLKAIPCYRVTCGADGTIVIGEAL
jgi:nitrite reductase/ring-hydroxylating ferredoxin subunit